MRASGSLVAWEWMEGENTRLCWKLIVVVKKGCDDRRYEVGRHGENKVRWLRAKEEVSTFCWQGGSERMTMSM